MATKQKRDRSTRYVLVVGFDFSGPSEAALREAVRLAGRTPGGEVHVVYALDSPRGAVSGHAITKLDARIEQATARLREYVTATREELPAQMNASLPAIHVRVGAPVDAIIQASVDLDADLVVVGAHHPEGLKGLLTSSTVVKLTRHARCPVLVVKAKRYEGIARSPVLEPQCPDCVAVRLETAGATWWCTRHQDRRALPLHIYSYSLDHAFGRRDADAEGP